MPVMATVARERKIMLIVALVSSVIVFILINFSVNIVLLPLLVSLQITF